MDLEEMLATMSAEEREQALDLFFGGLATGIECVRLEALSWVDTSKKFKAEGQQNQYAVATAINIAFGDLYKRMTETFERQKKKLEGGDGSGQGTN